MKRMFNLHRNEKDNCKTVVFWLNMCDTLMYNRKYNTVSFCLHEGEIGVAENVDDMNVRQVAKNRRKTYVEI